MERELEGGLLFVWREVSEEPECADWGVRDPVVLLKRILRGLEGGTWYGHFHPLPRIIFFDDGRPQQTTAQRNAVVIV